MGHKRREPPAARGAAFSGAEAENDQHEERVRIDKWLWAARFYKTRALAHAAVDAGRVLVDGERVKPSRSVAVGQELLIATPRGDFTITVERLEHQRGSATAASRLFSERTESKERREQAQELQRLARVAAPNERPNTQDRRLLRRIKEQG